MWYRWGEKTLGKFKSVIEWIFVPLPVYGIAGFEGTRSRAEETFISVLARKHSFHWADSWEMPLQVLAIHKTYRSAKSIKKLGCVPTSGLWIQWSSIHAFGFFDQPFQSCCYRLILATVFYNTLTWFCALLLRFGIHVPNANSQKSERSFFFFKFLATALQSISCVASTMFSSSTNVVTPHSTPNLRDLEWRCKRKIATPKPRQQLPSNKRHQLFRVKVCWWFSGSVPPRSQGRFAPHHAAMIWSVTSQVDVFFSEIFQHQKWDAKACQLRCMRFFSGLFCMVGDHHIKMFGDKMSQLLAEHLLATRKVRYDQLMDVSPI